MVKAIDKNYATGDFFKGIKTNAWKTLCSYTHSGFLQITRRFTGYQVKPNYKEGEITEVVKSTTSAIILLARMFFVSMGCQKEAGEANHLMLTY